MAHDLSGLLGKGRQALEGLVLAGDLVGMGLPTAVVALLAATGFLAKDKSGAKEAELLEYLNRQQGDWKRGLEELLIHEGVDLEALPEEARTNPLAQFYLLMTRSTAEVETFLADNQQVTDAIKRELTARLDQLDEVDQEVLASLDGLRGDLRDVKQLLEDHLPIDSLERRTILRLENERDQLASRLRSGTGIEEYHVLQAMFSYDPEVRKYALYYAGEYRISAAVPFILSSLGSEDRDTKVLAFQAAQQIRPKAAVSRLMEIVDESSDAMDRLAAMRILGSFGSDVVTQDNVTSWFRWFRDDDEEIFTIAWNVLADLAKRGGLDVASYSQQLIPLASGSHPPRKREYAIRMLIYAARVGPLVDVASMVQDPSEDRYLKMACMRLAFHSGDYATLEDCLRRAASDPGDIEVVRLLLMLAAGTDHSGCVAAAQSLAQAAERTAVAHLPPPPGRLPALSTRAISAKHTVRAMTYLDGHSELEKNLNGHLQGPDDPLSQRVMLIGTKSDSCVGPVDVSNWLRERHGFGVIDYRGMSRLAALRAFERYRRERLLALLLPAEVSSLVSGFLYSYCEQGTIRGPLSIGDIAFPRDGRIVLVMEEADYTNLTFVDGRPRERLTRMVLFQASV